MKKPNIIYFLTDQHNFGVTGFMGNKDILTPSMDKLASQGVVLENCYCNSPLCVPSRMSMLSGVLPTRTGILNNMQMYPTDQVTMAHSITNAGYESVLCGRMHFSGYDQRHGFEKRLVGDVTSSFPGINNEKKMYGSLQGTTYQGRIGIEKVGKGSSTVLKYDEAVADTACEFLKTRTDERPLFMIVGTYGPHSPYVAYEKWYDYYYENLPDVKNLSEEYKHSLHPAVQKWIELRDVDDVSDETLRKVRAAYYALITIADEHLGKVMKAVEENLDMENTIIVYTSDHGDNAGEHGLFWKTNFYDGASRVPAIISCPAKFKSGARLKSLTSLLDIAPTFIDLAGARPLPRMDGKSLAKSLETGEEPEDRAIISMLGDIKGDNPSAMIRKGRYKLVYHCGYEHPQLFDMEKDPHENNDLGTDERFLDLVRSLTAELTSQWNPEEAVENLKLTKAHYEMLKTWINNVGWDPVFEFDGKAEYNHIDG
jgi:choline-sulfatase